PALLAAQPGSLPQTGYRPALEVCRARCGAPRFGGIAILPADRRRRRQGEITLGPAGGEEQGSQVLECPRFRGHLDRPNRGRSMLQGESRFVWAARLLAAVGSSSLSSTWSCRLSPSKRRFEDLLAVAGVGGVEVDAGLDDLVDAVEDGWVERDLGGGELAAE